MSRIVPYTLIMSGMVILFYFAGITGSNSLLEIMLNPESMSVNQFVALLIGALSSISGIAIGIITRNPEIAAMTTFVPYYGYLLYEFINVFIALKAINYVLSIIIVSPILLLYFITLLDWWRGRA